MKHELLGNSMCLGLDGRQDRDARSWDELKELSFPAIPSLRFGVEKIGVATLYSNFFTSAGRPPFCTKYTTSQFNNSFC